MISSIFVTSSVPNPRTWRHQPGGTGYKNQADAAVFMARYENQADLSFFEVDYVNQAKGDALGFFVDYAN